MSEDVRIRVDLDDDTGAGAASVIAHMKAIEEAEKRQVAAQKRLAADRAQLAKAENQAYRDKAERLKELDTIQQRIVRNERELASASREHTLATRALAQAQKDEKGFVDRGTQAFRAQSVAIKDLAREKRAYSRAGNYATGGITGGGAPTQRDISMQREANRTVREATAEVKKHTSALQDLKKVMGKTSSPIDLGKQGVRPSNLAMSSAVVGLVALGRPLESLLGLLAAVPAAAGAAGLGIANFMMLDVGVIKKAADTRAKYEAQLKAGLITQKAYDTAIGKSGLTITDTEQKGLHFYTTMHDKLLALKKDVQHELLPSIGELGAALEKNQKTIEGAFTGAAKIQSGGINDLSKYLGSSSGQGDLRSFSRTSKIELAGGITAVNQFIMAMLQLNRVAEPMISKLSGDFAGMFAKFNAWTRSVRGRNALEDFFKETEHATVGFMHVLGNVGGILHNIFNAGPGEGSNGFLDWLDRGSNSLNNWLASEKGQEEMNAAWKDFSYVAGEVEDDLKTILPFLKDVASTALTVAAAFRDMVRSLPGGSDLLGLAALARFGFGMKPGAFVFGGAGAAFSKANMAGSLVANAGGAAVGQGGVSAVRKVLTYGATAATDGSPAGARAAEGSALRAAEGAALGQGAVSAAEAAAKRTVMPGVKAALTRVATRMGILGGIAVGGLVIYELTRGAAAQPSATSQALSGAMAGVDAKGASAASMVQGRRNARLDIANINAQLDVNKLSRMQLGDNVRGEQAVLDSGWSGGAKGKGTKLSGRDKQLLAVQLKIDRHELDVLEKDGVDLRVKLKIDKDTLKPTAETIREGNRLGGGASAVPGGVQNVISAFRGAKAPQLTGPGSQLAQGAVNAKFDVANLKAFVSAMDTLAAKAHGVDGATEDAAASAALLARNLGRIPTDVEVNVEVLAHTARAKKQLDDLEARRLHIGASIHVFQNDLIAIANHRLDIPAHIVVDNPNAVSSQGRYAGGPITKPTAIVGEEAPQHKEWVIATNPAYRTANKSYLAQAAADLGGTVSYHAQGGVMFGALPPAGYSPGSDPVPSSAVLMKTLFSEIGGVGELEKLQKSYTHMKERDRKEQLVLRETREKASKIPSGPGKKASAAHIQALLTEHRKHANTMSRTFERIQKLKSKDFLTGSPNEKQFQDAIGALDTAEAVALAGNDAKGWRMREGQELMLTQERLGTLQQMMRDPAFLKRMKTLPTAKRAGIFGDLNSEMGTLASVIPQLKQEIKDGFSSAQGNPAAGTDDSALQLQAHNQDVLAELAELARKGLVLQDVSNEQFRLAVEYLQQQGSFAAGTGYGQINRTGSYFLHAGEEVTSRSQVTHNNYHGANELKITGDGELTRMIAERITPHIEDRMGRSARNARRIGIR